MEREQLLLWIPIYMSVLLGFDIRPEPPPCSSQRVKAEVAEHTYVHTRIHKDVD